MKDYSLYLCKWTTTPFLQRPLKNTDFWRRAYFPQVGWTWHKDLSAQDRNWKQFSWTSSKIPTPPCIMA